MPTARVSKHYRLTSESIARIERIGRAQGGLTDTRVVELGLELLDRHVAQGLPVGPQPEPAARPRRATRG